MLDSALVEAAAGCGVDVRFRHRVTDLLRIDGHVRGVRVRGPTGVDELPADLVVGADGLNSTVAWRAGIRRTARGRVALVAAAPGGSAVSMRVAQRGVPPTFVAASAEEGPVVTPA